MFGCWTSASRKAVLPVFESLNGLLFYPVQYEGLEQSPNIFYTGAEPSQQIVPAVDYLLKQGKKKIYLLGSDYVFPRTANKIIKAQLEAKGGELAGEEYTPLGATEFSTIISKIQAAQPDAIFNTLNGDSNVAFFKQFKDAGFTRRIAAGAVGQRGRRRGARHRRGQHRRPPGRLELLPDHRHAREREVRRSLQGQVRRRPRDRRPDRGRLLRRVSVEAGGREGRLDRCREAVKAASDGIEFAAPEGMVKLDGATQHTWKTVRIGKVREDGLIDEVWSSGKPVQPDPFLKQYDWAASLTSQ